MYLIASIDIPLLPYEEQNNVNGIWLVLLPFYFPIWGSNIRLFPKDRNYSQFGVRPSFPAPAFVPFLFAVTKDFIDRLGQGQSSSISRCPLALCLSSLQHKGFWTINKRGGKEVLFLTAKGCVGGMVPIWMSKHIEILLGLVQQHIGGPEGQ